MGYGALEVISKEQAKDKGLHVFFTGVACNHGHVCERYVRSGACAECSRAGYRKWREKNKDKAEEATKRWRANNKEKVRKQKREWKERHKEFWREYQRQYFKDHPEKNRANANQHRARKLQAMPDWVDRKKVEKIYSGCPKGHDVDHIVPLRGKEVSGLHVPWNLQILTHSENCKKHNKLMEEYL